MVKKIYETSVEFIVWKKKLFKKEENPHQITLILILKQERGFFPLKKKNTQASSILTYFELR